MTLSQLSLQKRIPPPPSLELFAQPIFNLLLRFELTVPKPFPKKALLNLSDLSCPNIFYIFFFFCKRNTFEGRNTGSVHVRQLTRNNFFQV